MKKFYEMIFRVLYSFLILGGLAYLSFNLPLYSSWVVMLIVSSLILALAVLVYRLVELWETRLLRSSVFESEEISKVLTIDSHYQRGKACHLQGKTNKAIKEFKKILAINPNDSDVYYQLGRIYQEKGRRKEAVKFLKRYLELGKEKKWQDEVKRMLATMREFS